jgi:hypothetical protein
VDAWRRERREDRRWGWRESTSDRRWRFKRRIDSWRDSARAAAEPEERAWEEKAAESKEEERKAEKTGSDAKVSNGEG